MLLVHTGCCVDVCIHLPTDRQPNYIYVSLRQLQKLLIFQNPQHIPHVPENCKTKSTIGKKKKVKESPNRPGVAQKVPGGLSSQISMTFGTWRWWGCQPHAPGAFTPRKCSWYSFSLGDESTPGPWCVRKEKSLKNPVTSPGIDPRTVQLGAQCLNHYATRKTAIDYYKINNEDQSVERVCFCVFFPKKNTIFLKSKI